MIKILSTGFYSSIQDAGRFGFRHLGVPVSGCMDLYSFNLANALLNNSPDCSVIESTFIGPNIEFLSSTYIAITGAQCHLLINSVPVSINSVIKINKGDILEMGKTFHGSRNYLSVIDGFDCENRLNSQSQYNGLTHHALIQKNQIIACNQTNRTIKNRTSVTVNHSLFNSELLTVLKGPEFNLLTDKIKNILFSRSFTLSSQSNRMAYLFNQDFQIGTSEIITSSVQPGTVQLTPSGKIIILMRDAQTTGGYSRILQLTNLSISQLAQLPFNHNIRFCFN
jgi:biotin-dependent carboxylase-like uncharacterized protein